MAEFNVRSDNVDVERIMQQIRARIAEKRGVDYTEEQIRELAAVKLEKFLDPRSVRSDLVQHFQRQQESPDERALANYGFEDTTIYESVRAPIRWIRRLLNPLLKLFFNPNPIIGALHQQSRINQHVLRREGLTYEVLNNLVLELTRTTIEVKNLKMRLESMSTRLDFDERRARALEGSVQYRPDATKLEAAAEEGGGDEESEAAKRRRRRRRGRKRGPGGPADADTAAGPAADGRAQTTDSPSVPAGGDASAVGSSGGAEAGRSPGDPNDR